LETGCSLYLYLNVNADWNNFFISAFFQGVGKQQWWPSSEASLFWGQYNRPYNPLPKWQLGNYWTPDNTDAYLPRYVARLANRSGSMLVEAPQTKYLQNIAYLRLKNIQIGYNLPATLFQDRNQQHENIFSENLTTSPLQTKGSGVR
jgi:hypothetical protein